MQPEPIRATPRRPTPARKMRKSKAFFKHYRQVGPQPIDQTGQRLSELYPNGWDWIYSPIPSLGEKPTWETVKAFPLTPNELTLLHQDPDCLIGIRPGSLTRWGIIDIDAGSPHHPNQTPDALNQIRNTLEAIGIVRTLLCRSSFSGGLHLYIPLPEAIGSFDLSIALKLNLEAQGYKLRPGHLETLPNAKRYIPQGQGFSLYNGIRLPFQPGSGFLPLDDDLNPQPWGLKDWLDRFDAAAAQQDLDQLRNAIADAALNHRIRNGDKTSQSIGNWQERIDAEKQGWSGPGQSNEKFKAFACEARVFLGMDSIDQIAAHIETTALNTPGFLEHSNHQKDLKQRARDVAAWAMKYYWPMGGPSQRSTTYRGEQKNPADFSYHQAKREAAQHRIKEAVAQLQQDNRLPANATARAKAIAELIHISQQTLYKDTNKPLWHPDYFPVAVAPPQPNPSETPTLD
ncbi:MAG: hypothetical protein WCD18_24815, partial [Thermosynechococcaceae cyanobacterium]